MQIHIERYLNSSELFERERERERIVKNLSMASENGHVIITDVNWSELWLLSLILIRILLQEFTFILHKPHISHAMFNEGRREARLYLKEEYYEDLLWGMLSETCAEITVMTN